MIERWASTRATRLDESRRQLNRYIDRFRWLSSSIVQRLGFIQDSEEAIMETVKTQAIVGLKRPREEATTAKGSPVSTSIPPVSSRFRGVAQHKVTKVMQEQGDGWREKIKHNQTRMWSDVYNFRTTSNQTSCSSCCIRRGLNPTYGSMENNSISGALKRRILQPLRTIRCCNVIVNRILRNSYIHTRTYNI